MKSWVEIQKKYDDLVKEVQRDYEEMHFEYTSLKKSYAHLQNQYEQDKDNWRQFTLWWRQAMERKRQSKEIRNHKNPLDPNTPETSDHAQLVSQGSSLRLNKSDHHILQKVGLPTSVARHTELSGKDFHSMSSPISPTQTRKQAIPSTLSHIQEGDQPRWALAHSSSSPKRTAPFRNLTNSKDIVERDELGDDRTGVRNNCPEKHPESSKKRLAKHKTINAEYEIDSSKNNDKTFLYKDVVRDKRKRKHMHALDCECCREVRVNRNFGSLTNIIEVV